MKISLNMSRLAAAAGGGGGGGGPGFAPEPPLISLKPSLNLNLTTKAMSEWLICKLSTMAA